MKDSWKHALVLGFGSSGRAAAALLLRQGICVDVLDAAPIAAEGPLVEQINAQGGSFLDPCGGIPSGYDVCVVSPGIPLNHSWLQSVREQGLLLLPEFELGWMFWSGRTIAVTGSNGKSTVVKWLADCLSAHGQPAIPCGNYGLPVCQAVQEHADAEILVVELSSFQLETLYSFAPDAALLLNLLPNHLDRHGDMAQYLTIKLNMFSMMNAPQVGVMPVELNASVDVPGECRRITFGAVGADYVWGDNQVWRKGRRLADFSGTLYGNEVMGESAAGVCALLDSFGLSARQALATLKKMHLLPHRQEQAGQIGDIYFVNDSKATNLAALRAGILGCRGAVRLIAGGKAKEKDLNSAKEVLAGHVKKVYLIGNAAKAMESSWQQVVSCDVCETLPVALRHAWKDAAAGETILLSPGCTSYDQFRNFEERGEYFKDLVGQLKREVTE